MVLQERQADIVVPHNDTNLDIEASTSQLEAPPTAPIGIGGDFNYRNSYFLVKSLE